MEVDTKIEAGRIALGAGGVLLWGLTLNEWVAVATIIYMVMQILILMPKIIAGGSSLYLKARGIFGG